MEKQEVLETAIDALERLLKIFAPERYVYLVLTAFSFLLLLFVAYQLLTSQSPNTQMLVAIFGGTGLIAVSSARISWFFNKAFTLLAGLIEDLKK
jgi:hypothetical protein